MYTFTKLDDRRILNVSVRVSVGVGPVEFQLYSCSPLKSSRRRDVAVLLLSRRAAGVQRRRRRLIVVGRRRVRRSTDGRRASVDDEWTGR